MYFEKTSGSEALWRVGMVIYKGSMVIYGGSSDIPVNCL